MFKQLTGLRVPEMIQRELILHPREIAFGHRQLQSDTNSEAGFRKAPVPPESHLPSPDTLSS